jgi:CopG family nickel-responsive transcriptional regulator
MSKLVRMSVSLEKPLYQRLDKLVKAAGYTNRSEYVRDMIRERLVQREWEQDREVVGTLTLLYDHHTRQLTDKLTDLAHDHHDIILSSTHVHLDHDHCLEVALLRGRGSRLRQLADTLRKQKGVLHAALSLSSTGTQLE